MSNTFDDTEWGVQGFGEEADSGIGFDEPDGDGFEGINIDTATGEVGENPLQPAPEKNLNANAPSHEEPKEPVSSLNQKGFEKNTSEPETPMRNDLHKMVSTFDDLYSGIMHISQLAYAVINEFEKAGERASTMNVDTKEIALHYDKAKTELQRAIQQTYSYFDMNKTIVQDLSEQKRKLQYETEKAVGALKAAQDEHASVYKEQLDELNRKIGQISASVNVKGISKDLEKNIKKEIEESGLGQFNLLIKQANEAAALLNKKATLLLGDTNSDRLGVIDKITAHVTKLEGAMQKTKSTFKMHWLIIGAIVGLAGGVGVGYATATNAHQFNMAATMGAQIQTIDESYRERLNSLNEKLLAYQEIEKRGGLKNNSSYGFGYYTDTKTPYFYFPKSLEVYTSPNGGQVIVELP